MKCSILGTYLGWSKTGLFHSSQQTNMSSWTFFGSSIKNIGNDQSSKSMLDPGGFHGWFSAPHDSSVILPLYKLLWLLGHLASPENCSGRPKISKVSLTPSKTIPEIFPESYKQTKLHKVNQN